MAHPVTDEPVGHEAGCPFSEVAPDTQWNKIARASFVDVGLTRCSCGLTFDVAGDPPESLVPPDWESHYASHRSARGVRTRHFGKRVNP